MPLYEITPHGFLSSNYSIWNTKDDKDTFEVEEEWFSGWGFRARVSSHAREDVLVIQEKVGHWSATFELLDENGKHYATVTKEDGVCCSPDFFKITREKGKRRSSKYEDDEDDAWFTVEEEGQEYTFRLVCEGSKAAKKVARLDMGISICYTVYQLRISSEVSRTGKQTVLATAIAIIQLKERERRQRQHHHHAAVV